MADTHEEQLLSALLGEIGDADRAAQTPAIGALEARVLAGCDVANSADRAGIWKPAVVAGVAAAFAMAIGGTWLSRERPALPAASSQLPVAIEPPATSRQLPIRSYRSSAITQTPIAQSPRAFAQSPITQSPMLPQSPTPNPQPLAEMDFLPLRPLTEQELSGPFQVVRVQVPLASLGGLTSPLQHPSELVKADVLLGEDGVAHGIRIASDESNYPWRFR